MTNPAINRNNPTKSKIMDYLFFQIPKRTIAVIIDPPIKIYAFDITSIFSKVHQAKGWREPKDQQINLDRFGR